MKLKILVRTPKGQAKRSLNKLSATLLGYKLEKKIIEKKLINNKSFYWILEADTPKVEREITTKCARGDVITREFFKAVFKIIRRANKVASKFKKGGAWAKRWVLKKLRKQNPVEYRENDMYKYIEDTPEDDFLVVKDQEAMDRFLAQKELISVKEVKE